MRELHPAMVRPLAAATAVVLALTLFMVEDAGAADAPLDKVTGGFENHFGEHVGVAALSGPSGQNPFGHESATRPGDTRYRLAVVCLAVDGNTAAYGTIITKSNNPDFPVGFEFVEVVRDGGAGGRNDGWDIFDGGAFDCAARLSAAHAAPPIASGNIKVTDS